MMDSQKVIHIDDFVKRSRSRRPNLMARGILAVRRSDSEMKRNEKIGLFTKSSRIKLLLYCPSRGNFFDKESHSHTSFFCWAFPKNPKVMMKRFGDKRGQNRTAPKWNCSFEPEENYPNSSTYKLLNELKSITTVIQTVTNPPKGDLPGSRNPAKDRYSGD